MERQYHITEKGNTEVVRGFLSRNGQALLPWVEQIEQAEVALDEVIDVLGRATVEMVLRLSAERIAGPPWGSNFAFFSTG